MLNIIYCILEKIICNLEKSNRIRVLIFSIFSYMFTVRKRVEVRVMFREESATTWAETTEALLYRRVEREIVTQAWEALRKNRRFATLVGIIINWMKPEEKWIFLCLWLQTNAIMKAVKECFDRLDLSGLLETMNEQPSYANWPYPTEHGI